MTLEFNHYGICLDSGWCYLAFDWKLVSISALVFVGYKIVKRKKESVVA
jgi:hypothetical protein